MLPVFDFLRNLDLLGTVFRLLLAFAAGALIGLERSYKNKPAGFRTHILVSLGAAIASMTGPYLYLVLKVSADMSRIPGQVITGLGFIGGGTIYVTRSNVVRGLTTAAGLWTAGIVGLAIGAGYYELGLLGLGLVLICQTYFGNILEKMTHYPDFRIALSYLEKPQLEVVMRHCKDKGAAIANLQITGSKKKGMALYSALLTLRPDSEIDEDALLKEINGMEGIVSAEILK